MEIYHGSNLIIDSPEFGKGNLSFNIFSKKTYLWEKFRDDDETERKYHNEELS